MYNTNRKSASSDQQFDKKKQQCAHNSVTMFCDFKLIQSWTKNSVYPIPLTNFRSKLRMVLRHFSEVTHAGIAIPEQNMKPPSWEISQGEFRTRVSCSESESCNYTVIDILIVSTLSINGQSICVIVNDMCWALLLIRVIDHHCVLHI